ncbi:hypothetical protein DFH07DRAFT_969298 [Mycena maculata]|uniref:Uncharacterized protein n=1 Tax=Mycena maculata TaxID=230809 RepID=A0AAD7HWS5_9AGAR|nr:hypothetical protein DFH07DRAFT_969298 [Mycena maculata]
MIRLKTAIFKPRCLNASSPDGSFFVPTPPAHPLDLDRYPDVTKRLVRKGGIIIVGRSGRVCDESDKNSSAGGVRALLRHIKDDQEVEATTIHTVGEKGFDAGRVHVRVSSDWYVTQRYELTQNFLRAMCGPERGC